MDHIRFTNDKLSVESISNLVASPTSGAVSIFVGTTRDNFDGKTVVNLEYEAFEPMAVKQLQKICFDLRTKWPTVENIAVYHRLGSVPVKEISIVIAISSPHRADAMLATQWCIDNVKSSVPIWKKEIYADGAPEWKENKESHPPTMLKFKLDLKQDVELPCVSTHLVQIKASNQEIEERINKFMERKRNEINKCNIRDFCRKSKDLDDGNSCARIDSVLVKRKDSKGHLQVNRVYNNYSCRDQDGTEYLSKHIPKNGIEERLQNIESQLNLKTSVPKDIYDRLRELEDRLLYLESISPEYIQFWDKDIVLYKSNKKKKVFSLDEIDNLILDLEVRKSSQKR